ncbi:MAG: hypothetical protein KGL35_09445 [Bradyrhizobium sp.]|nr:hypothetical protein [Bradyrhizobium sp.]
MRDTSPDCAVASLARHDGGPGMAICVPSIFSSSQNVRMTLLARNNLMLRFPGIAESMSMSRNIWLGLLGVVTFGFCGASAIGH